MVDEGTSRTDPTRDRSSRRRRPAPPRGSSARPIPSFPSHRPGTPPPRRLEGISTPVLFRRLSQIEGELRSRGVRLGSRDLATSYVIELAAQLLDLEPMPPDATRCEARGEDGTRYRIRGWRLDDLTAPETFVITPGVPERGFEAVVLVLLDYGFRVIRGVVAPVDVALDWARYRPSSNDWVVERHSDFWSAPGVEDRTTPFQILAKSLRSEPSTRPPH